MKYAGPQNVKSLMQAFDSEYTSQRANAKPASSVEVKVIDENTKDPRIERIKRIQQMFFDETITTEEYFHSFDMSEVEHFAFRTITDGSGSRTLCIEYTQGDVDAKYPRDQWIQMLLEKGVRIDDYKDYKEYLDIRTSLFPEEYLADDDVDASEQSAYIDKEIKKYQRIQEARRTNPDVKDWTMIGENALPSIPGRMYVCKTESGFKIKSKKTSNAEPKLSEEQRIDLQDKGIEPEGWEVVYIDEKGNIL